MCSFSLFSEFTRSRKTAVILVTVDLLGYGSICVNYTYVSEVAI